MDSAHRVIRKSLNNEFDSMKTIAGIGFRGSTSYMLNSPNGIFVDTNLDLYIADCFNNRIQLFPLNEFNGITAAGNGSSVPTIKLDRPAGVALDRNKYLFIADRGNSRIVASSQYGFRCVAGCSASQGTEAYRLWNPRSVIFDSVGNIFVADEGNCRIQKFILITNSCSK